jgi:hypothetical protein
MKPSLKLSIIVTCMLFVCLTGLTQTRPNDAGPDAGNNHWRLKREIQIGDAFTSVTIFAGFVGFLVATIKDRRKKARDESQSGALRLLLKLLRESRGPMTLAQLKSLFDAPETKELRKAYCAKDFKFKNPTMFEAAVYRLHWEGKIDFVSSDEIAFRVHERFDSNPSPAIATAPPLLVMFTIFRNAFLDQKMDQWGLEPLARSALTYDRQATSEFLAENAKSPDAQVQRRAAVLLGQFPPPRHVATS